MDQNIELAGISAEVEDVSKTASRQASTDPIRSHDEQPDNLPPADKGKDAWLFLAACFMVEALVWGFPFSFGLFQEHYSRTELFKGQKNIAVIGTCAMVQ